MRYYITGLDGVEREVTEQQFKIEQWGWRVLFGFLGLILVLMGILAIGMMIRLVILILSSGF